MEKNTRKNKLRVIFSWILWVVLIQLVLVNATSALYAYKLTHFYEPVERPRQTSRNFLTKTWKLFTGPRFQKQEYEPVPLYPFQSISLSTTAGSQIEAWYIPADSSKGTVIIFHGLGSNKATMLDEAYEFRYLGYNTMLVDLRGHGHSDGNTTTLGVREAEDVKLAYEDVVKRGEKNIILYGLSLGAVVITKSIYDYGIKPSKIILDAPFASLRDHLRGRARVLGFPSEPFATLVTFWAGIERGFKGFRHDVCKYAGEVDCPVLLQYGALDNLVLPTETNAIFSHLRSKNKKLVIYQAAGHGSFLAYQPAKWRDEIKTFLNK